ncbi:WD40/YVTN/BNR-like repeat-containing protein [Sinomicrobium soli]|uniref:WD40/YVTN/BNR-like repeat-containing protein n=1 Tax=Sinomicrobium sp. N-1-3-6 TaxID=2219864 RepID=UPI000DCEF6F0|nr:oxidoreductase [Sinomicrobium sp. N-1-3-6]RAV27688.1 oxidoreductase [Sinomicrobium sp. N-1-3-6]
MNRLFFAGVLLLLGSCGTSAGKYEPREISGIEVTPLLEDSMSVRALEIAPGGTLWFADDRGRFGYFDHRDRVVMDSVTYDTVVPHFRAVASNGDHIFLLSIGSPALLYKTNHKLETTLVYRETDPAAFYDSMKFWNGEEGIAMGDPVEEGCLSVLITRNGGDSWSKVPCELLPQVAKGEAAFAASNTNIAISGDRTWIVTGGTRSRVFYSPDKGRSWKVYDVPVVQGEPTLGMYSVDFWDKDHGYAIGGDYTRPQYRTANKARTGDGGKTWQLVASNRAPGYRSCVQYVPGRQGRELVAAGFEGVAFSADGGEHWKQLSDEGFYTVRFLNDSTAYAAGKGRVSRILLRKKDGISGK